MINYIQQPEKKKKRELKQLKIGLMVIGYEGPRKIHKKVTFEFA